MGGKSTFLRVAKCLSFDIRYSACPQTAQSTNLLSSGSCLIKLKRHTGDTRIKFFLLRSVCMMESAKMGCVFSERISSYSINLSVDTHISNLFSRKAVHTAWYILLDGRIANKQLVSMTILLIMPHDMVCASALGEFSLCSRHSAFPLPKAGQPLLVLSSHRNQPEHLSSQKPSAHFHSS